MRLLFLIPINIILTIIIIFAIFKYLQWGDNYLQQSKYNTSMRDSFKYNLLLPAYLLDSWKPINFWTQYYIAVYT